MIPNHCVNCGCPYHMSQLEKAFVGGEWPLTCRSCSHMVWDNPTAVVIVVQPVHMPGGGLGLAMGQRAILPKIGEWCLIAGHVKRGETFEQAAVREFVEETSGLEPGATRQITRSHANDRGHIMAEVLFEPIPFDHWLLAEPCHENLRLGLWGSPATSPALCFPIHQQIATEWRERNPCT